MKDIIMTIVLGIIILLPLIQIVLGFTKSGNNGSCMADEDEL